MAVQRDEYKLVSASGDKSVRVWDMRRGECLTALAGHSGRVLCMQFDRQRIITGSADKQIKIWDYR